MSEGECGVCYQRFTEKKRMRIVLTCEHQFCKGCLETSIGQHGYAMKCLLCDGEIVEDMKFRLTKKSHADDRQNRFDSHIWPLEQGLLPMTQLQHAHVIERYRSYTEREELVNGPFKALCERALQIPHPSGWIPHQCPVYVEMEKLVSGSMSGKQFLKKCMEYNYRGAMKKWWKIDAYDTELLPQVQTMVDRIHELLTLSERRYYRTPLPTESSMDRIPVFKCHNAECRGFLNSSFECTLCNWRNCPECHMVLSDMPHVCDPNERKSVEFLIQTSKPCPNPSCRERISKIDGCDQMFCVKCFTVFSWNTGTIQTKGNLHNPEYIRMIREWGIEKARSKGLPVPTRDTPFPQIAMLNGCVFEIDDIQGGGPESIHVPLSNKHSFHSIFEELYRLFNELGDWSHTTPCENYNDMSFLEFRAEYLANRVTEATMKQNMFLKWQQMEVRRELIHIPHETSDILKGVLHTCQIEHLFSSEEEREQVPRTMGLIAVMLEDAIGRLKKLISVHYSSSKRKDSRIEELQKSIEKILSLTQMLKTVHVSDDDNSWFGESVDPHRRERQWMGTWIHGQPSEGISFFNNHPFIGPYLEPNTVPHLMYGIHVTDDYEYRGDWVEGHAHGHGKYIARKKYTYEGPFVHGQFDGRGVLYYLDDPSKQIVVVWDKDVLQAMESGLDEERFQIARDIVEHLKRDRMYDFERFRSEA